MYPPQPPDDGIPPKLLVDALKTLRLVERSRPIPPDLMARLTAAANNGWRDIDGWRQWIGRMLVDRYL